MTRRSKLRSTFPAMLAMSALLTTAMAAGALGLRVGDSLCVDTGGDVDCGLAVSVAGSASCDGPRGSVLDGGCLAASAAGEATADCGDEAYGFAGGACLAAGGAGANSACRARLVCAALGTEAASSCERGWTTPLCVTVGVHRADATCQGARLCLALAAAGPASATCDTDINCVAVRLV